MECKKIINYSIDIVLLLIIIFLSFISRLGTLSSPVILDYDPWWFYRYAKNILENNFVPPKWDLLSFFPPGRPIIKTLGWDYTLVFFYLTISLFSKISFMEVAKLSSPIMVGLAAIPAYFLGKELSNRWGGAATAIFSTLAPTFIGVSMAGYCDTDVVVVFYTFITILSVFLVLKKRKIPYIVLAVLTNLVFIYNWGFGWYILIFFIFFIPFLLLFRIIENIRKNGLKINLKNILLEFKSSLITLLVIVLILNLITVSIGLGNIINAIMLGLGITGGGGLLVNVSVAELQPINIFTREGFNAVTGRVGLTPTIFMLIGLPLLVLFKFYRKKDIGFEEVFLFFWVAITFYFILSGVRFSLLFSCAVAVSAGYVIGNLVEFLKRSNVFYQSTVFGIVLFLILMFVSDSLVYATQAGGMEIGQNWVDMLEWLKNNADKKALIETWWDPGHIIAGYTGLRVHADGAHCSPDECIPYNHNVRIQDMGKIMSTSDEEEAFSLITKYKQLKPEDCQKVKNKYGNIVPEEACEPASEIYFIVSSDLIGKFTWMNYFGGYRASITSNYDFARNPGVCCASTPKTEPGQVSCGEFASQGRGVWVWCPWIFSLKDIKQDQEGNPVYIYDYGGLTMALIQKGNNLIPIYNNQFLINHLTFFYNGQEQNQNLSNLNTTLERIDGLVWIQPDFRSLIYFAPTIKDSMFTRLFFYGGKGLKHFEPVFSNPEIRLYRVK